MSKITIEYEHPHELTDLLGKLMQMYVVPEPICGDIPYPENYAQGSSVSDAKLKGAEERALTVLEKYHVVCDELHYLREQVSKEREATAKYRNILEKIYDSLIPKQANPHGLSEFTVEQRMNDFPALIEGLIAAKKWNDEDMKDAWMTGVNDGRDSVDSFKFKTNSFNPSEWLSNYKKYDSQSIINTSDTAFIADTDSQLFTLEEAAEYLEVEINEMSDIMAGYLHMTKDHLLSLPNIKEMMEKGFLLSELRKIKKRLGR